MPDKPMQKRPSLKRASLISVGDAQTSPAANSNDETKVLGPVDETEEMPLPSDPKVIFLGGLFTLALLAAAYEGGAIVWPFVFAFILQLLSQPVLRILERLRLPRLLAAPLLIFTLLGAVIGLGTAISGPAVSWAAKLPDGIPRLQEHLRFLETPISTLQQFWQHVSQDGAASSLGTTLVTTAFTGTRSFASGFFTTLLFLFFLLVSGDIFLQRLVEIMPRFSGKRQVVDIAKQIESDITAYLVTITVMNAAVGFGTAAVMWLTGVGDPILWGTVTFLLNFVPILGPILGVVIFLLAGLLTSEYALVCAAPCGTLPWNSLGRGRDNNADASCQTVYPESRSGYPVARLLVLDVGGSRRDPVRAHAGNN
jgi:predicted PurR-regulated permease PerM